MSLIWIEKNELNHSDKTSVVFFSECHESNDEAVKVALGECIEKSIALLKKNITDDSMFLLFEWNTSRSALTVVLTDDTKTTDSPYVVACIFSSIDKQIQADDYAEQVRYWLRDYFTTCSSFMRFSLVAAFHSCSRDDACLL